jgi:RNA polymerase sigma-70 factor (ECF subfamily)
MARVMKQAIEPERYAEFIRRIRSGDPQAAEDLVRLYEPEIRLEVRSLLRLRDPRLRRVFDSMDICQSVLASFFVRAAVGEYDLERPEQLAHLLAGIARNKLSEQAKHHQRKRRDVRRVAGQADEELGAAVPETPSQHVAGRELLSEFRKRLSEEERQLAELRGDGLGWDAIVEQIGGTADGRRKQLARAIERIERELGLVGDES